MMHVLLIFNKPENLGDLNQCRAVAELLAESFPGSSKTQKVSSAIVRARPRTRLLFKVLESLGCWKIIGPGGRLDKVFTNLFRTNHGFEERPDVIVSRLPSSEHAAVALKTWFGVPAILVGHARLLKDSDFDAVITTNEGRVSSNEIVLETVPTQLTLQNGNTSDPSFNEKEALDVNAPVWCFLVGGGNAAYPYTDRDYRAWVTFMEQAHQVLGIRWLISTSRRTSSFAEQFLRHSLEGTPQLLDATWWHSGSRKTLRAYIDRAKLCLVTAESESMLSDCISFLKPVVGVRPDTAPESVLGFADQRDQERIERFLSKVQARRRAFVCHSSELEREILEKGRTETVQPLTLADRWDKVVKRELLERGVIEPQSKRPPA